MFMGDVGSAPLGYLLACIALWMSVRFGWWLMIPLFLLHVNFVFDTAFTLARRVCRSERWYAPHREHFYQRLIRSGKSHPFVTGWEIGLQILVLLLLTMYPSAGFYGRVALAALVCFLWAAFFIYCEVLFRRSELEKQTNASLIRPQILG